MLTPVEYYFAKWILLSQPTSFNVTISNMFLWPSHDGYMDGNLQLVPTSQVSITSWSLPYHVKSEKNMM